MPMKLSLYRKYRPQTFDEVVGQDHVARTLRNAVATDSVAHAYVFAGPRGIGKTSMAKILAKALNCAGTNPDGSTVTGPTVTPCGVCEECTAIAAGTSLDVIEMDAASNRGIDDIRDIRDKVAYSPVHGRSKVYIIDEVHMLTEPAFNALLKTLEEPPPHVVFVLATTEAHKIPATILSRCQRFDFKRPRVREIRDVLRRIAEAEAIDAEDAALTAIAQQAEGSFRDAIGILDQAATFFEGRRIGAREVLDVLGVVETDLLFELVDIVIERDVAGALLFVQRLSERGPNYAQFIRDLMKHLREVFIVQHTDEVGGLGLDEPMVDKLRAQANQMQAAELVRFIEVLGQAQAEIRAGLDARLQLELALVKVTKPQVDLSPGGLEERLRRLEAGSPAETSRRARPAAAAKPGPGEAAPDAEPAATPKPPADGATGDMAPVHREADDVAPARAGAVDTALPPNDALERIKRGWNLILEQVQGRSVPLYAALKDARPTSFAGSTLTLTLPSEFALTMAAEPPHTTLLAETLHAIVGATVSIEYVPAGTSRPAPAAKAATEPNLSFAERIALVEKTLDARQLPDDE
jgi:DNA polymerase-3 subunit gamma/tau